MPDCLYFTADIPKHEIPEDKRDGSKFCCYEHKAAYHKGIKEAGKRALGLTLPEISEQQGIPRFHNTINLQSKELDTAGKRVSHQEEEILEFFKANGGLHTPCEVSAAFPMWPITSVRRSITDLTKAGLLRKTTVTRPGNYNVINFCWTAE